LYFGNLVKIAELNLQLVALSGDSLIAFEVVQDLGHVAFFS